ncbi:hypothetical protein ACI3PL_26945, partial [Lacticaseibacillus paracasei]
FGPRLSFGGFTGNTLLNLFCCPLCGGAHFLLVINGAALLVYLSLLLSKLTLLGFLGTPRLLGYHLVYLGGEGIYEVLPSGIA